MVNVLAWNVVNYRFEPWSDLTKDYEIGICCFSAKHTAKTDWLGIRIICPKSSDMSTHTGLFQ